MTAERATKESVWNYPRPPRLEPTDRHLLVIFADQVIAETRRAFRILETSHPPTYYFPPQDVNHNFLVSSPHRSFCEFKGTASYLNLVVNGRTSENAGWFYLEPTSAYAAICNYIAFYPARVDACFVDGEKIRAQ